MFEKTFKALTRNFKARTQGIVSTNSSYSDNWSHTRTEFNFGQICPKQWQATGFHLIILPNESLYLCVTATIEEVHDDDFGPI